MRRLVLAALLALTPWLGAQAHHILGVPHYAYSENYPQLPFVEIVAQAGKWDLRMSYFPGIIEPGERIRFKLYGKNRETMEPLRVPLVGQARKVVWGDRPEPVGEAFPIRVGKGPEGNDYKFFLSFPEYEAYEVLVRFEFPDGTVEEIPFPVTVGVTDDTPILFGAIALLIAAVVTVRILKQRDKARGEAMAV